VCERTVSADKEGPLSSERERARARTDRHRQAGPTGQREGERARARSSLTGGSTCQATQARAAWLGWIGPNGLNSVFLFPWNF
jgi:hypothetical protein